MSILAFQKLSGTLSTEGKSLEQLQQIKDFLTNRGATDLDIYFKRLYPNSVATFVEKTIVSSEYGKDWSTDLINLDKPHFGIWTITSSDGKQKREIDEYAKFTALSSDLSKVQYYRAGEAHPTFIGTIQYFFREYQSLHFTAHFVGYVIETNEEQKVFFNAQKSVLTACDYLIKQGSYIIPSNSNTLVYQNTNALKISFCKFFDGFVDGQYMQSLKFSDSEFYVNFQYYQKVIVFNEFSDSFATYTRNSSSNNITHDVYPLANPLKNLNDNLFTGTLRLTAEDYRFNVIGSNSQQNYIFNLFEDGVFVARGTDFVYKIKSGSVYTQTQTVEPPTV